MDCTNTANTWRDKQEAPRECKPPTHLVWGPWIKVAQNMFRNWLQTVIPNTTRITPIHCLSSLPPLTPPELLHFIVYHPPPPNTTRITPFHCLSPPPPPPQHHQNYSISLFITPNPPTWKNHENLLLCFILRRVGQTDIHTYKQPWRLHKIRPSRNSFRRNTCDYSFTRYMFRTKPRERHRQVMVIFKSHNKK